MSKPIANVTVAIGTGNHRWHVEQFETHLTYEECKDQSLLLSEAEEVMDLGDDVSFIVMTFYERIEFDDHGRHPCEGQACDGNCNNLSCDGDK